MGIGHTKEYPTMILEFLGIPSRLQHMRFLLSISSKSIQNLRCGNVIKIPNRTGVGHLEKYK